MMSQLALKTFPAEVSCLDEVQAFVAEKTAALNLPSRKQMHLELAVEEIVVNICNYAYAEEPGEFHLAISTSDDLLEISFSDNGPAFDPLKTCEPDTNASLSERTVGGLGIFLVRKVMDDISYERKEHQNILRVRLHTGDDNPVDKKQEQT